jgi:hypothetical protein
MAESSSEHCLPEFHKSVLQSEEELREAAVKTLGRWGAHILAVVLVLSVAALAGDPPGRVARLQYMSGEVSVQPGGVNDWVPGVINRPLTTADRVWTDKNSRAELNVGTAVLRANSETSLTLTNVSDGTAQIELDQGTLNLRVRHLYHGEIYEIDTPNVAFTVMKSGEYRFDVDPNGDTTIVTVWHGEGEATGLGRAVRVKHGQTARFTGGPSLTHQIYEARGFDGFDDWCRVRDKRQDYSQSVRYAPGVIGVEDLDDYGTWRVVPAYGTIWVPAVGPGWAPYHYGHWAWIEPWGWTWIDDAPWGFAPCHYGRWVYYNNYWGWAPGPVVVRPVYAPALVAWVGGSNWGVSLAFGGGPAVGWFPLGYGEPYLPPYGVSRPYFRNVNVTNTRITNITNITNNYYNTTNINKTINSNNTTVVTTNNTNITKNNTTNIVNNSTNINGNHNNVHINYVNQKVPGAVTAVPSRVLANSEPVANSAMRVPERELKETLVATAPSVAPSRNSVLGPRAGERAAVPPAQSESRKVFAKLPAPPKPVPFSAKEQELTNRPGRPLDSKTEDALRTRLQREPAGMQVRTENKSRSDAPLADRPAVKNPELRAPVASTPGNMVPGPAEKTPPPTAATEQNAVTRPENRQAGNADTPRSELRIVPRPPEKMRVENPAAAPTEKPVQASENRPAANALNGPLQNHSVPRPSQVAKPSGQGSEPVITMPRAQPRMVPRPPTNNSGSQVSATSTAPQPVLPRHDPVQARPAQPPTTSQRTPVVARAPQRAASTQAASEPVVSSPRAQPRIVPQPPTTNSTLGGNVPRRDPAQARPPQPQPSAPRQVSGPSRSPFTPPPAARQSGSSAQPMYQPRAASSASQAGRAPSGGGSVRSQATGAPAAHAQPSKNTQNAEQRH